MVNTHPPPALCRVHGWHRLYHTTAHLLPFTQSPRSLGGAAVPGRGGRATLHAAGRAVLCGRRRARAQRPPPRRSSPTALSRFQTGQWKGRAGA